MTFNELLTKFPDERSCIDYYVKVRYPYGVFCPHCASLAVYQRHDRPKVYTCKDCNNTFSVFRNTIFEHSPTDLRKWFYAIHMFLNGKKGISGLQLQREIGVTYKTAWRMLQQIRQAMGNAYHTEFFDTIIEMDETYIGGKPRKDNDHKDDPPTPKPENRGRGKNKTPVVGVIDRKNKIVYAKVAISDEQGKKLTSRQLFNILSKVSKPGNHNIVITDEFRAYNMLDATNYIHLRIDHSKAFSDHMEKHTNNIESFWATLKRGIYGIYHHVSIKYLQRYVDEFCFRYNNRKEDMFAMVLKQSIK